MKDSLFNEASLDLVLKEKFGFSSFRPGQREAIHALLTRGRALCILPTGHGKSLLYQLPTCLLDGNTIVISPLIALMRDQIAQLNNRFHIPAGAINTDQSDEENAQARSAASRGYLKVLFVAPEQLDHVDRFDFLCKLNPSLIVIDEAHCISTWGHDFRPSYRQILQYLYAVHSQNPSVKILGITATANSQVEQDIKHQLNIDSGELFVLRESMERPNIHLAVCQAKEIGVKLTMCAGLLKQLPGCGLVYCATRENTEMVAEFLKGEGINATYYHAGCDFETKRQLQEEFTAGNFKAIVATNALGMGIDKSDLRFILHFDMPGSITAYYQEVGRCGRDGLDAYGILLYSPADSRVHEYFIQSAVPSDKDFEEVLKMLAEAKEPPNLTTIKRLTGLHPTRVNIVIAELIEQGFIAKRSLSGKQVYGLLQKPNQSIDLSRYKNQLEVKSHELAQILHYGKQESQCRMAILRKNLGDSDEKPCSHCDVCSEPQYVYHPSNEEIRAASDWLACKPVPIAPAVKVKLSEGLAILNGTFRSSAFVQFMRERREEKMDEALLALLCQHALSLAAKHDIVGIVPLPSRTWAMRNSIAERIARRLNVPVYEGLLQWHSVPANRQGELLNNDQRKENVEGCMVCSVKEKIGAGTLILLDDYVGSGHTLKEAARAFRSARGLAQILVPFTVAAVKWHLGKPGFV
jgi:ATP-dependent DNA helicase RecQ